MQRAADWRSEAAYDYVHDLAPRELAWEFLRRNPDYQTDFRRAAEHGPEASEPVRHWGLCFRGRSAAVRQNGTAVLAAPS